MAPTLKDQPLLSSKRRPHFNNRRGLGTNINLVMGHGGDPEPTMTVLAKASSKLLLCIFLYHGDSTRCVTCGRCDPRSPVLELCRPQRFVKELRNTSLIRVNLIWVPIICYFKGLPKLFLGRVKVQINSMDRSSWEANRHQATKIPVFCGTRRFITAVFTWACHLSISWARWISQILSSCFRIVLILSSHMHLAVA
jgi:hypothetical protein